MTYDGAKNDGNSSAHSWDENDPDLAAVVTAWPTLPEHVRAAVMALVATAKR